MCGINGIISKRPVSDLGTRIYRMNKSIEHRGPDDDAVWCDQSVSIGFGHRRLSIIDLDQRSKQPMISNSGRWLIVFNGEIYNYKELKKKTGYAYRTHSDTEVILAYVEEFGIDRFLQDCNGMFAIGLYDLFEKTVYICRDRMGIKPLYYYHDNERLIFSSEIKGILNSGLIDAVFNETAIDEYLANRYVRAPYSFFQGIYQVLPGTYRKYNRALEWEEIVYWDLPQNFNMEETYNEEDLEEEFMVRLKKAIVDRMAADVPVGTYLSGGVDSSIISAIAAKNTDQKLNTYTIGFEEMNEFSYAEYVAKRYQTDHHEIKMTMDDYFSLMDEAIEYKDAPLGVPNEIPLLRMSRELKKKITVVLSGEGADELMGGYGRIFRSPFDYRNLSIQGSYYDYLIALYEYVPRGMRDEFLLGDKPLRREFDAKIREEFIGKSNEENIFHFFHKYHVKGLLQRVDATTMPAGVEARVPFLDHTLIEYVYKMIPYSMKLRWNDKNEINGIKEDAGMYSEKLDTPKYLLKKAAEKYLPKSVIYRKKMGFPIPLDDWFQNIEESAGELLKNAYWLKESSIERLVQECRKNVRAGQILWMFLNVEMFRQKYFSKQWRY